MIAPSSEEKPLYSHVVSAVSFPYHILYSLVLLLSPTLFAYKLSSLFILPFLLSLTTFNSPLHYTSSYPFQSIIQTTTMWSECPHSLTAPSQGSQGKRQSTPSQSLTWSITLMSTISRSRWTNSKQLETPQSGLGRNKWDGTRPSSVTPSAAVFDRNYFLFSFFED